MALLRGGVPIDWYPIDPIDLGPITADTVVTGREARIYGWSFTETTGTDPAHIVVVDGTNVNGEAIVDITLDPGQSTRDYPAKPGLQCRSGVAVAVISGSVRAIVNVLQLSEVEIAQAAGYVFGGE